VSAHHVYFDENSPEPPLLAVNHQIRHEAAELYYLANAFRIVIHDFHPYVLFRLELLLAAVNIELHRFWSAAPHQFGYRQLQPQDSWRSLKFWLQLIHQGACYAACPPPHATTHMMRHARGWIVFGGMFHLVQQLSGTPWSVVERVLEEQRFVLAGVVNLADVFDQDLLPLVQTPTVSNN
jgi:hypothetical protein